MKRFLVALFFFLLFFTVIYAKPPQAPPVQGIKPPQAPPLIEEPKVPSGYPSVPGYKWVPDPRGPDGWGLVPNSEAPLSKAVPAVTAPQPFRSAIQYNPSHTCNQCGHSQFVINGSGPVPGSHTHTCGHCGNTWFH